MKKLLILALFAAVTFCAAAQELTVATYNIRNANRGDAERGNGWERRGPWVCRLIEFHGRTRSSPHPAASAKACSVQRATCWDRSPRTVPCRRRSSKPCAEIFHASESHGENGLYHAK